MPVLFHVSEDPDITIFRPHRAPTATRDDEVVWAIDERHLPAYWFPRDCPRATFWLTPRSSPEDRSWMHGAERVHAIEWDWWERFREARLYRYEMPAERFTVHDAGAGYYIAREPVVPLACRPIGDLIGTHAAARIELRVVDELWPLWDRVTRSTLGYSGIRLRNARPRGSIGKV